MAHQRFAFSRQRNSAGGTRSVHEAARNSDSVATSFKCASFGRVGQLDAEIEDTNAFDVATGGPP
jgi:hypothetical protein